MKQQMLHRRIRPHNKITVMKLANYKRPLFSIMFSVTLGTTLFFSSCKKDSSVTPDQSASNINNLDRARRRTGTNLGGTTTSGTTTGGTTTGGTTTGGTTTGGTTTGGTTTGGATTGGTTATTGGTTTTIDPKTGLPIGSGTTTKVFAYKGSAPISLSGQSNITISGDSISGGSVNCISLTNCSNVHITKCKLINSSVYGISLSKCTNVTIDSCFISNVAAGVHAFQSATIKTNSNQFLNMNGPMPDGNFVQYSYVTGGGNQIMNNRCENIVGVAQHPQDGLSVYKSDGLPGDSIMVTGNWIRGGQVLHDSGGAAGIVLGDVGGSYQVARNNIIVNPGSVGAQVQGGSHITMDHNIIYSSATTYSVVGIAYGNYSGAASTDITMSYNTIRYYQTAGTECDMWWDPATASQPIGWSTNIGRANIDASILPAKIITMK